MQVQTSGGYFTEHHGGGTNVIYRYGDILVDGTAFSADTTLYAYWTGGATLPTATRNGYTFDGWYTEESGGIKIGNAGATYMPDSDTTLYAHWTANYYTLSLGKDNASISSVRVESGAISGTGQVQYGSTITVQATANSHYKQDKIKWTDSITNISEDADSNGMYTFEMPAYNVTMTASSEKYSYDIYYDYGTDDFSPGTYSPDYAEYGEIVQISNPTRPGYTFTGWTTTTASSGACSGTSSSRLYSWDVTSNPNKDTYYENLRTDDGGRVTLVANWNADTYRITLDPNGGTLGGVSAIYEIYDEGFYLDQNGEYPLDGKQIYAVEFPTRSGYRCVGFYNGDECIIGPNGQTGDVSPTKFTSNATIKAKWEDTSPTKPYIGSVTCNNVVSGNKGKVLVNGLVASGVNNTITEIYYNKSGTAPGRYTTWKSLTGSSYSFTTDVLTSNTTYYVWVKDSAGKISDVKSCTITVETDRYEITAGAADSDKTHFTTLSDAINGCLPVGGTIKLINTFSDDFSATVPEGKFITIDLNGKTLTRSLPIYNDGNELTVKNGTLSYNGSGYAINSSTGYVVIGENGNTSQTITIKAPKGGGVKNDGTNVFMYSRAEIKTGTEAGSSHGIEASKGGSVTISGYSSAYPCTITSSGDGVYSTGEINIDYANIIATGDGVDSTGTININHANIESNTSYGVLYSGGDNAIISNSTIRSKSNQGVRYISNAASKKTITITNSNIRSGETSDSNALFVKADTTAGVKCVIDGNSSISNGTIVGATTTKNTIYLIANASTTASELEVKGNSIITSGPSGGNGIYVQNGKWNMRFTGSSSIHVVGTNNNNDCIDFNNSNCSGSSVTINSTGYFIAYGRRIVSAEESANITNISINYISGFLASAKEKMLANSSSSFIANINPSHGDVNTILYYLYDGNYKIINLEDVYYYSN